LSSAAHGGPWSHHVQCLGHCWSGENWWHKKCVGMIKSSDCGKLPQAPVLPLLPQIGPPQCWQCLSSWHQKHCQPIFCRPPGPPWVFGSGGRVWVMGCTCQGNFLASAVLCPFLAQWVGCHCCHCLWEPAAQLHHHCCWPQQPANHQSVLESVCQHWRPLVGHGIFLVVAVHVNTPYRFSFSFVHERSSTRARAEKRIRIQFGSHARLSGGSPAKSFMRN